MSPNAVELIRAEIASMTQQFRMSLNKRKIDLKWQGGRWPITIIIIFGLGNCLASLCVISLFTQLRILQKIQTFYAVFTLHVCLKPPDKPKLL